MKKETRKKNSALVKSSGVAQSYSAWIADLKRRYRATQIKAAVAVNSALIEFYWNLGKDITEKFAEEAGYGSRFFEKVSFDMRTEFPNDTGFSPRNIRYCQDFYRLYSAAPILPQVVAKSANDKRRISKMPQVVAKSYPQQLAGDMIVQQLEEQLICVPWGHHRTIIDKCKRNRDKALFYVRRTIQNGWSRNSLLNWLSTDLYEREGKAQTNFDLTMPSDDCDLARQLVKDPQKFEVFGSSFLHRAVASLSRRGGQDRQVRTCRSRTAERLHGDCEACLEHAGRQPARRASHLQGTQPRPRQVPFGGTWPADGHHRLRAQEGTPLQGAIGQVRHRRRAANCGGFIGPSCESAKFGHKGMIG